METENDGYVGGVRSKTSTGEGRYAHPNRKLKYPGVTAVIGSAWPSGYLEDWRIGNIATRCVANTKMLRKMLKRIEQKPEKYRDLHIPALQKLFVAWKEDFTAANRGTRIHRGLELRLSGDKSQNLSPEEESSVEMALHALQRIKLEVEYLEAPVYNHNPRYAGTVDIVGTIRRIIRGKRRVTKVVVDLKTGKRVSRSYIPQLAAYSKATELLDEDKLRGMPDIGRALVLHVRPDSAQFYDVDIESGWQDFLACHRIYTSANSTKGMSKYDT